MKRIETVVISSAEDQKTESVNETELLEAIWSVPVIASTKPLHTAERINGHYQSARRFMARYVYDVLIPQAKRQKAFYDKFGFPFLPHGMASRYTITLNSDGILSLYTDRYEYAGGANGFTTRIADTWNLQSGFPLHLSLKKCKRKLMRIVEEQAKKRMGDGEMFFEPLRTNLRRYWKPDQWYLTEDGLALFYGQVTVAPHASGIPVFVIPYEQLCGIKPLAPLLRDVCPV